MRKWRECMQCGCGFLDRERGAVARGGHAAKLCGDRCRRLWANARAAERGQSGRAKWAAIQAERRAAGTCLACGDERAYSDRLGRMTLLCELHLEYQRTYARLRRGRLRRAGMCVCCGRVRATIARARWPVCDGCEAARKANWQRRIARMGVEGTCP